MRFLVTGTAERDSVASLESRFRHEALPDNVVSGEAIIVVANHALLVIAKADKTTPQGQTVFRAPAGLYRPFEAVQRIFGSFDTGGHL
jgi:hypothetical protein